MNKNFRFFATIWAVLFAIFNIVTFIPPSRVGNIDKFEGAFWVGFIFITIAFVGQLAVSFFAFSAKNMQKFFYKVPLIRISWTCLILTLICGSVAMYVYEFPKWLGAVICLTVLGFNAISLVKSGTAAEVVSEIDDKVKVQTYFIKSLTIDTEVLMNGSETAELKGLAKKVYEAVRYSDPMSDAALVEAEQKIQNVFSNFETAVIEQNLELAVTTANDLLSLIDIRNKKCKLLKLERQ